MGDQLRRVLLTTLFCNCMVDLGSIVCGMNQAGLRKIELTNTKLLNVHGSSTLVHAIFAYLIPVQSATRGVHTTKEEIVRTAGPVSHHASHSAATLDVKMPQNKFFSCKFKFNGVFIFNPSL